MRTVSKRMLVAVALSATLAVAAHAQRSHFEITPFVGGYIPTKVLGLTKVPGVGSTPITIEGEVATGGAFGGRITYVGRGRLGAEATYFAASSDLRIARGPIASVFDAKVRGGSLKGVYRATSEESGTDLVVAAGLSGVNHRGQGFAFTTGQFDIGGVAGAGLHIVMSPQITLRFDGEAYIYSWSSGIAGLGSKLQTDVLMTAGLGLRLGR